MANTDQHWMRAAIEAAVKGWGTTHPNPMVGAVIVERGEKVAQGWHAGAGKPHAEIAALSALGRRPGKDAVLYLTLEPCSTHGRTPPCTTAILESGIRKVVVGATDPNPNHAGSAYPLLREHGIEVVDGVLSDECSDLNLIFNYWITHGGTPFVAIKLALTLDGKIAARNGQSKWITGPEARADVGRWRRYFPAIAVGAETVLMDNPSLTSRRAGHPDWCPRRFVFDSSLRSFAQKPDAAVYTDPFREKTTLVAGEGCNPDRIADAERSGIKVWTLQALEDGRPDPDAFVHRCRVEAINGIWLEGGAQLINAFLARDRADYLYAYTAPVLLGDNRAVAGFDYRRATSIEDALRLRNPVFNQLGEDRLVRGYLKGCDV